MNITSMIEIDVFQVTELAESSEVAAKEGLPAIVVHPGLSLDALMIRRRMKAQYKIIIPIDWPKGELKGVNKFLGVRKEALEADGFEIAISIGSKTPEEIRAECMNASEFIRSHLGEYVEVRWVLEGSELEDSQISTFSQALVGIRNPSFIRNDVNTKIQNNKANADIHNNFIKLVKEHINVPIKISGNISQLKSLVNINNASRYGVNLQQARNLIKDFHQKPAGLKEILTNP